MPEDGSSSAKPAGAVPAWKLRQSMQGNAPAPKAKSSLDVKQALKKKMEEATLDPNLPSAFKVAISGRVAFAKQQARRKNNDTFVSLNSSHPAPKEAGITTTHPESEDDDDSSFASMGEDILEEESEEE